MSTITATTPRVKSSAFGAGILEPEPVALEIRGRYYTTTPLPADDGVKVVRVSAMDDAEAVYDVSRGADGLVACTCGDYVYRHAGTASTCKHGAAVVEAGLLDAPAPVVNDEVRGADVIPASVVKVRVTSGPSEGVWVRPADRLPGCRWRAEGDTTGRWVAEKVMSDWLEAGKVAILADAPTGVNNINAPTTTPAIQPADEGDVESDPSTWPAWTDEVWTTTEPAPAPVARATTRRPSAEDLAFEAGRAVAIDCEGWAEPPRHYTPAEVVMFRAGQVDGARVVHFREMARLEDLERQATVDMGDSYCW